MSTLKRDHELPPDDESNKRLRLLTNDPLENLNFDVLHVVGPKVALHDLIRLSQVSKGWQEKCKEWIVRLAIQELNTIRPQNSPRITISDGLPEEALIRFARQQYGVHNGALGDNHRTSKARPFASTTDFMARVLRSSEVVDIDGPPEEEGDGSSDFLYWKWTRKSPRGRRRTRMISAGRFFDPPLFGVRVKNLAGSDGGQLLIQLEAPWMEGPLIRNLVYCLHQEKILWYMDCKCDTEVREVMPMLLGQSRVYLAIARKPGSLPSLVAIDLHTKERLYDRLILPRLWFAFEALLKRHLAPRPGHYTNQARLIHPALGEELVLILVNVTWTFEQKDRIPAATGTGVDVINGRTGYLIQTIHFPGLTLSQILTHHLTRQMVMMYEIKQHYNAPPHWIARVGNPHRVVILKHYTYDSQTGFTYLHTDAVCAGTPTHRISPVDNFVQEAPIAINPFYKSAITYDLRMPGSGPAPPPEQAGFNQRHPKWMYQVRRLEPCQDPALEGHIRAVVQRRHLDYGGIPSVRQCFVVSQSTKIPLLVPPRGSTRPRRQQLALLTDRAFLEASFTEEGNVVVESPGTQWFMRWA